MHMRPVTRIPESVRIGFADDAVVGVAFEAHEPAIPLLPRIHVLGYHER